MTDRRAHEPSRLEELLADRALQGLSVEEDEELATLVDPADDAAWEFEFAAAAIDLPAALAAAEPMPAAVRARVEVDAVAWLATSKGLTVTREPAPPRVRTVATPAATRPDGRTPWLPWLAAAAGIALALLAWWPGGGSTAGEGDIATRLSALRADAATRVVAWNDVATLGVKGEIVWNDRTQSGFMIFDGLDPNDPRAIQYQLWIFDNGRAGYSPHIAVDGGVFDVEGETGRVIVPFTPKLEVFEPTLFAVTTEPPGGVVEHNPELDPERYRIILTADPTV
ncbi:MAG: hypothetical protein HKN62_04065 [Phycisphaerales bacterium]|nr:hypothetical protein [Phycisphaerales bacterium]